jgi:hypothetical protein
MAHRDSTPVPENLLALSGNSDTTRSSVVLANARLSKSVARFAGVSIEQSSEYDSFRGAGVNTGSTFDARIRIVDLGDRGAQCDKFKRAGIYARGAASAHSIIDENRHISSFRSFPVINNAVSGVESHIALVKLYAKSRKEGSSLAKACAWYR